jgi:uncharacterized repeat protein (TIGR01451 family)
MSEATTAPEDDAVTVDRAEEEWSVVVALGLAAVGLAVGSPVLLAGATIPLWYTAAASFAGRPETTVAVHRELAVETESVDATRQSGDGSDEDALSGDPGETVTVRTTLRNAGSVSAVDLRLVDGVPDAVPVVEGTPRTCVTLAPGEETTIEYEVELQRGEHVFGEPALRARDLTGGTTVGWETPAAGGHRLVCSPTVERAPLGDGHNDYAGEVPTEEGGSGVEFHSVRDYEPGDPVRSIDWRRYANTRDLATVEYRAERSTRILCVVDARSGEQAAPAGSELSTVELGGHAAERTAGRLLAEGHPTGAAVIRDQRTSLVPPGTGNTVRERAIGLLGALPENAPAIPARRLRDDPVEAIPRVVPGETQVYLFSSFVDDTPLDLVEHLRSQGYGVCVVSPDVAGSAGFGAGTGAGAGAGDGDQANEDVARLATQVTAISRDNRLARARATGATVVEWEQR